MGCEARKRESLRGFYLVDLEARRGEVGKGTLFLAAPVRQNARRWIYEILQRGASYREKKGPSSVLIKLGWEYSKREAKRACNGNNGVGK